MTLYLREKKPPRFVTLATDSQAATRVIEFGLAHHARSIPKELRNGTWRPPF
jgi:hypothetical protein